MARIERASGDLNNLFIEQIQLLKELIKLFDNGSRYTAKAIAATLRILLVDRGGNKSLLGQLGLKDIQFLSTALPVPNKKDGRILAGSYAGLIAFHMGNNGNEIVPYLNDYPKECTGYTEFDKYWNETIFIDQNSIEHSRKDIVLTVAEQDGGVHIDPSLEEKYAKLSRQNSMGWVEFSSNSGWNPVKGVELVAIRQIAHEILKSLDTEYKPPRQSVSDGITISGITLEVGTESKLPAIESTIRNKSLCICNSGKKYKKCGLINSQEHQKNLSK